jgi:hypothetical protein
MGSWVELNRVLPSQEVVYCGACGGVIPRRVWVADDGRRPFCSPECAALEARVEALHVRFPAAQRPPVTG